nr:hypothetical protein Itr_chr13CG15970 [Ipomoea trifida]
MAETGDQSGLHVDESSSIAAGRPSRLAILAIGKGAASVSRRRQSRGQWLRRFLPSCSSSACHSRVQNDGFHTSVPDGRRRRRSSSLLPAERGSGRRGGSPLSARPRTEAGDGGSSSVSPCRIHVPPPMIDDKQQSAVRSSVPLRSKWRGLILLSKSPAFGVKKEQQIDQRRLIGGNIKPPTVVSSNGGDGILALFSGDEQQSLHVPVGMQQAIDNDQSLRSEKERLRSRVDGKVVGSGYGDFSLLVPRRRAIAECRTTGFTHRFPTAGEGGDHRRYSRRNEVAGVVAALPSPLGQERKQATAVAAP